MGLWPAYVSRTLASFPGSLLESLETRPVEPHFWNVSYLHRIPCQPRADSRVYTHIHRNPLCYCRHTSPDTQMSPGHTRLYLCSYNNNMAVLVNYRLVCFLILTSTVTVLCKHWILYFDRIVAFKAPYHWTFVKGQTYTHFIGSLDMYTSTKRVWAQPLTKSQRFGVSNVVMLSKYRMISTQQWWFQSCQVTWAGDTCSGAAMNFHA